MRLLDSAQVHEGLLYQSLVPALIAGHHCTVRPGIRRVTIRNRTMGWSVPLHSELPRRPLCICTRTEFPWIGDPPSRSTSVSAVRRRNCW